VIDIWFTADTHFGHANILKFKREDGSPVRTFSDVEEMDEIMIERWNAVVKPGDTVWHLGDVFFRDGARHLSRLHGVKSLILGNHDTPDSIHLRQHFGSPLIWKRFSDWGFIATHFPLHDSDFNLQQGLINVHGHIHEKPAPTDRHRNIGVERTDYRPVHLDEIIASIASGKDFEV